jgi:quinol-cytochrome oxidoreductase complex cytochrome b subunit/NAD-dependent dihydropyrimidine dehydrogenase PreA subunit
MYESIIQACNKAFLVFEDWTNKICTNKYNPMYYHGALPQFFLWILFLSGLLLFAYYIPTIDSAYLSKANVNAYNSVAYITDSLPFGGIYRGLHRYAGDAMVLTILLHMIRVWFTDRYRQDRWVQWLSGVLLLVMVMIIGQTGYYLVWDERSLVLTRMTVSAFDALPVIGPACKQLFLNGTNISNLTMSNFLFIHIGLSFGLLWGLWLHYMRMTRPVLTPPPAINYIMSALTLLVVFAFPIASGRMADLNAHPTAFEMDAWFLWPYWLMAQMPAAAFWATLILGTIFLCIIPLPGFLVPRSQKPVGAAEVVINKCTGCNFCYQDCPWQAIEMVPAPAGSRFKQLAVVMPYRCTGCGVCVGACAFDAIDIGDMTDTEVNTKIKALLATT